MEIADFVSCDFYYSDRWDGTERSELHIKKEEGQVSLEIETERQDSQNEVQALTTLSLDRIDVRVLRRIQTCLGDWLQEGRTGEKSLTTRPLEGGEYRDGTTVEKARQLQIDINREGLHILALNPDGQPVDNAIRIPPTNIVHDDGFEDCVYLERLYSLFEIFLAGFEQETDDVLRSTGYLMNPETHLHPRLPSVCIDRLQNDDYEGVIQAAATALEELLEEKAPDQIVQNSSGTKNLIEQTFSPGDPVFHWGYENNEQSGLQFLYSGAFMSLRNPMSHRRRDRSRNRFLDDINEKDALDALCLFNFLVRRLETYGTDELEHE